ncbi:MAG: FAD-dependent oxidoreductase [Kiloniellales bacterium]
MTAEPGVVIIGAGHAGGRAAERLRFHGYDKPITLIGNEPHLPYERPPLSKAVLTAEALAEPPFLLGRDDWLRSDIAVRSSTRCLSIDRSARTVALSCGRTLPYAHLILATGLTQRRLAQLDGLGDRVLTLHSYDDARALRQRLGSGVRILLIGAGFIGLEVAASARQSGAEVVVIEAADRALARALPAKLSDWIARLHRDAAVEIHFDSKLQKAERLGDAVQITLDGGETHVGDLVLCGIGGQPNDDLARQAGLDCSNGVRVDHHCRTSDPNIFAIGDIACLSGPDGTAPRRLESWKNAEDTAAVAAANICGLERVYETAPWFWTDQYGLNIQFTGDLSASATSGKGQGEQAASLLERGSLGESGYLAYLLHDERLLGAFGIDCGRDIRRARAILEKGGRLSAQQLMKAGFELGEGEPAVASASRFERRIGSA